jgi:mono/diheme cytochrome c family protein
MVVRKVKYSWQTGSAMLLNNYEFPIIAKNMAPAREACENCHKPEKFSADKLVEIKHFAEDEANTLSSTFLVVKTGGGSSRQGLGFGIHWHIENPVYFYANDSRDQDIPYIVVENADGTRTEYIDVESNFDPSSISQNQLKQMDCITCHNRAAHMIDSPQVTMDKLLGRGLVSKDIPEIKQKGVEVLSADYHSVDEAKAAIAGLKIYYQQEKADYFNANSALLDEAIVAMQAIYERTNFPNQEVNSETHFDNLAHKDAPGCFRCHDGKHLDDNDEAVRLECNLCHSIPVVSGANQLTASLELSKGFEPESHLNASWINLHRTVFDESCQGCHTIEDPGGASDTSFCSNSACHGADWPFAGFDAPNLRAIIAEQALAMVTPTPAVSEQQPTQAATQASGPITYEGQVAALLKSSCGSCHGAAAMKGLNVLTYADLMKGSQTGPVVVPGSPADSSLLSVQEPPAKHFGQFSPGNLELVRQWILEGAVEK